MDNKNKNYIKTLISYIALLLITVIIAYVFTKILPKNSFGADSQTINLQANIKKYINYKISDQEKGTLLQYDVKTGIDYKEDEEQYIPVKQSQIKLEMNQIDNKYPYDVKVIARSTEATNGKKRDISELYRYNNETGILIIQASNVNENGELINKEKINKEAQDEYTVICNYDTYIEEAEQREIDIKAEAIVLLSEDNRMISKKEEFKGTVQNNIGELTSVEYVNSDIYNGNIKSNIINGTNYDTEYKETQKIVVSKKEAQDEIWIIERNSFINTENNQIETDLGNNGELLYKSTKLYKSNLVRLLGEEGTLVILDSEKNLIATIDKNTEYDKDGTKTINYQDNIESIIIKTSKIQNEGILELENTKAIKNTMRKTQNVKINTTTHLFGVKNVLKNNETIKEQVYRNEKENTIEIKDSTTDVKFDINKTEWTNKEQNELVFDISLNSNSIKNNLFKNPTIKIELPKEVEKVILGDSHIVYGNGLELRDVHVENDENGMFKIIASIEGSQTTFNENSLGLNTNIKIPATVILKKDIQSEKENIKLLCTNDFTLDDNKEVINKNVDIEITSYQQEDVNNGEVTNQEVITTMLRQSVPSEIEQGQEKIEGLDLEVVPVKGDTVLKNGDTVYEGEFIKYNIKVTNTSDRQIDNIKIVGSIPEGTTYAELEADYHSYMGKYEYNYDNEMKNKELNVGTLKSNEKFEGFYEVRLNDLEENIMEKDISTRIKMYVNNVELNDYNITNTLKEAELKVFLGAFLDNSKDRWNYSLKVESKENKIVPIKLIVPKEFELEYRVEAGGQEGTPVYLNKDSDNVILDNIETNKEYWYEGLIDSSIVRKDTNDSKMTFRAIASAIVNDITYTSNENRIEYELKSVSITMSSENEGEEVDFEDEINYEITIKNTGRTNYDYGDIDVIAIDVQDYLPEELDPVSMEYEYWEEDGDSWVKKSETKNLNSIKDKKGKKLPNVDLSLNIPYEKEIKIRVKTTARAVSEKTKIENSAIVTGDEISAKTSNKVIHTILPINSTIEEGENSEDNPEDNPKQPSDSDNSINDQGNEKELEIDRKSEKKYSISGVAWLDENQDGQRQEEEQKLNGIKVILVNSGNSSIISNNISTNNNGEYKIDELEEGKYIVLFQYDTEKYNVTEYKKSEVSNKYNSDVNKQEITLNGETIIVGATDELNLDNSITDIDIGLIKNGVCDFKLDKYISKVTVDTAKGTKQYSYNNEKLAKVEIKSKEINEASVTIEYKIVLTNEGETPAQVGSVIDNIPEGLDFSSQLNKDWSTQTKGQLVNNSLSNTIIKPGESVSLSLILNKKMTQDSTGKFINSAEIGSMSNSFGMTDVDSTPNNNAKNEDDYSEATIIISISTGEILYIGIVILALIILIVTLIVLNKKGILKNKSISKITKLTIFVIIFSGIIFTSEHTVWSEGSNRTTIAPSILYFNYINPSSYNNMYGSTYFEASNGWGALCQNAGAAATTGNYKFNGATGLINSGDRTDNSPEVDLKKERFENRNKY